ncbi:MAG: toll/interleukin-1 receptor domain-containing protein [Nitrospira sp.]|nr:toll/interleukin-1 receptor domain-containing protein [Nitrospira sp.]
MSSIFISYRREDSAGWTGRLVGQLKKTFGQDYIFSDIDTIEPGADFTEAITCAVGSCDILLAVIGPRWITETDTNKQRRLDDPADWVRIEIAAALTRKIRVIPVLVGRANMPAAKELPPDIKALAERQAHELSDKRWDFDCQQLIGRLQKTLDIRSSPTQKTFSPESLRFGALALVIALLGIAYFARDNILSLVQSSSPKSLSISPQVTTKPSGPPIATQAPSRSEPKQETKTDSAQYPIHLRANQEVRLPQANQTYKILSADLDRATPSTVLLRFVVRLTTSRGAGLWNDNFRLMVDGVPRAPVSKLSEFVDANSAKEGTVEFTFPDTITRVTLQLRYGDTESAELPIDLTLMKL